MYIFVLLAMTFVKYKHPLSGDMGLYYHSKAKDKIPEDEQLNYPFEVRMYGVQIIHFAEKTITKVIVWIKVTECGKHNSFMSKF
jgi:16S rRNA G527 N7-methylase RsmG